MLIIFKDTVILEGNKIFCLSENTHCQSLLVLIFRSVIQKTHLVDETILLFLQTKKPPKSDGFIIIIYLFKLINSSVLWNCSFC